ncbi:hypothetical protein B0H14DRAFT_3490508 [Mycena olivaceomarginata]|nr:hypothetical protein B0H14DRAFT_3490508 [Mycena olivaceomarginata]
MVTCASHHAYFASILFLPLNLHTRPSEALQPCHPGLYGQVISRPLRVCRLEFDDDKQPIKETSKVVHTGIIGMSSPTRAANQERDLAAWNNLLRERLQPSIQPSRSSVPIQRPQPPPLLAHLGADYRCSTERRGQWTTSPTQVLDAAPRGRTTTTCAFLGNIQQTPCDPRWWRPAAIAQVPFHESDLYATLDTLASAAAGLGENTHLLHLHDMALLRRYLPLLRFAGPPPPASQIFPQALLAYPEDTPSMMIGCVGLALTYDDGAHWIGQIVRFPPPPAGPPPSSRIASSRLACALRWRKGQTGAPLSAIGVLLFAIHAVTDNPNVAHLKLLSPPIIAVLSCFPALLLTTPFTGPISLATALLASDLKSVYIFRPRYKPRKSLLELDCYICTCLRYIVTDNILVTDFCRTRHSFVIVLGASSHSLPAGPTAQVV